MKKIVEAIKHKIQLHIRDRYAIWKSKNKIAVDLPSHAIEQNRNIWNNYDWTEKGEEWTRHAQNPEEWKIKLLQNMMFRYFKPGSIILEIGPGAGRWTEHLQKIAQRLVLVDIAPRCIEICKERFADYSNIEYHIIENNINFIPAKTIDFVWSYDVFVHINPSDIKQYVQNFKKILKPGGIAIIHHSSGYDTKDDAIKGFRANMTSEMFAELISKNGLRIMEQNTDLVHKKGDVISVFQANNSTN